MATEAHIPLRVFLAYAEVDTERRRQVENALAVLRQQNLISIWNRQNISAGGEWEEEITRNLNDADIILLLTSIAFLASDYCYDNEMTRALERHQQDRNQVRVIPIILDACDWRHSPLNNLQVLPNNGQAIFGRRRGPAAALTNVATGIRGVVHEILEQRMRQDLINNAAIETTPENDQNDNTSTVVNKTNTEIDPIENADSIANTTFTAINSIITINETVNATTPETDHNNNPVSIVNATATENDRKSGPSIGQPNSSEPIIPQPNLPSLPPSPSPQVNGATSYKKTSQLLPILQHPYVTRSCLLLLILILGLILFILSLQPTSSISVNIVDLNYTNRPMNLGSNAITVGLSDGQYAFDTLDAPLKSQAAQAFLAGKKKSDTSSWYNLFINHKLIDGESCIYAQDQNITGPFFTVVATVTLSRPNTSSGPDLVSAGAGEEELQGICLKQMYYNDDNNGENMAHALKMRVIIANIGARAAYLLQSTTPPVIDQIKQIASQPSNNFIGIIGLPFSTTVNQAMDDLDKAGIPVISPSASSSEFNERWTHFHRAVSSTNDEGTYAAQIAPQLLQFKKIATPNVLVFQANKASNDPYSTTLGDSFTTTFGQSQKKPYTQEFDTNAPDPFSGADQYVNKYNLIFCACFSNEFQKLLPYLIHYRGIIMGGEALYDLEGYPKDSQTSKPTIFLSHYAIYFTSFAFPDEIRNFCNANLNDSACSNGGELMTFYPRYCQAFDHEKYTPNNYYENHNRKNNPCLARPESHLTLSYDATSGLLNAYQTALQSGKSTVSTSDMTDTVDFQGITGHIQFKSGTETSSNAVNKVILAVCFDKSTGQAHSLGYSNSTFFKDTQQSSQPPALDQNQLSTDCDPGPPKPKTN